MTTVIDPKATVGEGGGGGDSGEELTPEQIATLAADKKLANENANTRRKLRDAEKREQDLASELEELKKERETGTATGREAASEAATLKREIADLRKENKERKEREAALEEKAKEKSISSTLSSIVSKLQDPNSAVQLLKSRAKVAADDQVVLLVKDPDTGEMVEKEATIENIKAFKLLPDIYYPPQGTAGSGGRGGESRILTKGGKGEPVDLDRALTDFQYYKDNREAINQARRLRKAAA